MNATLVRAAGRPGDIKERCPGPKFAMVAGEASGDLLAALLLGGLNRRWPALVCRGIGGPRMQAQGFEAWWPHSALAVHGYAEALRHYREISSIRSQLAARLAVEPPDLFIGIDAPDFNLGLEARLRRVKLPCVQFVCPSIWAWRGKRIDKIAESADLVLCLFPFEPELLATKGIAARYVGHPLADTIPLEVPRAAARQALALGHDDSVVALMPGSRRGEIAHLAPTFLRAAVWMHRQRPGLRFVLPVAHGLRPLIEPLCAQCAPDLRIDLLDGRSHEALAACDVTLIASGTATLEAALFKRPMVIAYRMHWLSYLLMKRMGYLPWIGLPNILCRDFVVPELVQDAATPEALGRATLAWLDDAPRVEQLQRRFLDLHYLLRRDTSRTATDAIAEILAS